MLKKWKLILATSVFAIAGLAGIAAARGGGEGHRAGMLKKFDENGDGKLDDAERAKMKAARGQMKAKRMAEMLAKYDANKNGALDADEKKLMKHDRAAARFKKLDTDGNGVLSPAEFEAGAMHGRGKHRGHRGH
ncbi:MAG: hypothetical protein KF773_09905 [Deltaproteobacteria bacterium]|nr:hypothetical protein [Deltaproteobacteria bacterium]MCW5808762.1 hypothetical protein [Deltaproteobacteria bacterium]